MGSAIPYCDLPKGAASLGLYGCSHAGAGCARCWAETMAWRYHELWGIPAGIVENGRWTGRVEVDKDRLVRGFGELPGPRSKVRTVFPFNTGDLFHEDVPNAFITEAFCQMDARQHLTFQILTKRTREVLSWCAECCDGIPWSPNLHLYASASTGPELIRAAQDLAQVPVTVRGLSLEPLITDCGGDMAIALGVPGTSDARKPIHHVIVGCESGAGRRRMRLDWAIDVVVACKRAGVPVFVKQLELDGKVVSDPEHPGWPEWAVREMPGGGHV